MAGRPLSVSVRTVPHGGIGHEFDGEPEVGQLHLRALRLARQQQVLGLHARAMAIIFAITFTINTSRIKAKASPLVMI